MEIWRDLQHYLSNLFELRATKTVVALLTAAVHQAFGEQWLPIHGAIVTLYVLDWITGLWRAVISAERITSSSSLRGVVKGLVYASTIIVAQQLDSAHVTTGVLGSFILMLVVLTEAKSNLENLEVISTKTGIDIPLISFLIELMRRYEKWAQRRMIEVSVGSTTVDAQMEDGESEC